MKFLTLVMMVDPFLQFSIEKNKQYENCGSVFNTIDDQIHRSFKQITVGTLANMQKDSDEERSALLTMKCTARRGLGRFCVSGDKSPTGAQRSSRKYGGGAMPRMSKRLKEEWEIIKK